MKRDLLFTIERLTGLLEEHRLQMLARQHGIRQKREDGGIAKTLTAYIRRADEGTLSRLLVETAILLGRREHTLPPSFGTPPQHTR